MAYRTCTLLDLVTYSFETFPIYNGKADYKALSQWFAAVPGYSMFKAAKMATATQLVILGDAKQMRVLAKAGFDLTFN
jgi:hypothetical protein